MPRPGWLNENQGRTFPFLPHLQEILAVSAPATGPGIYGMQALPNSAVVDFHCVAGLQAYFREGVDRVYLSEIRRAGSQLEFEFRSTAPGLVGRSLVFERSITDDDYLTEHLEDAGEADPLLEDCPGDALWSVFLITGPMEDLASLLADGEKLQGNETEAFVEPALVHNLAASYLRSVNIANAERTRAENSSGCLPLTWTVPQQPIYPVQTCLTGRVRFMPGYNTLIDQDVGNNALRIGGEVGAGEGEPCGEVPLYDGEAPPLGGLNYSGSDECSDVIRTVAGVGGRLLELLGGTGVSVEPDQLQHRVIVDMNLRDLAVCLDEEPPDEENCPPEAPDPLCGNAIVLLQVGDGLGLGSARQTFRLRIRILQLSQALGLVVPPLHRGQEALQRLRISDELWLASNLSSIVLGEHLPSVMLALARDGLSGATSTRRVVGALRQIGNGLTLTVQATSGLGPASRSRLVRNGLAATQTIKRLALALRRIGDGLAAGDTVLTGSGASVRTRVIGDGLGLGDTALKGFGVRTGTRLISAGLAHGDTVKRSLARARRKSSGLAAGDTVLKGFGPRVRTQLTGDGLAAGDTVKRLVTALRRVSATLALSDTIAGGASATVIERLVSNGLAFGDAQPTYVYMPGLTPFVITYDTPGTYIFTVPPGVTSLTIEGWGAGGQGSNNGAGSTGGGGGGGGGYSKRTNFAVTPGGGVTVVVGAGGSGGTDFGGAGGQSSCGGPTGIIARGGAGGNESFGGAGGQASSGLGTVRYSGGTGGPSNSTGGGGGAGGGGSGAGFSQNGTNGQTNSVNSGGAGGSGPTGGAGNGGSGGDSGAVGVNGSVAGGGGGGAGNLGGTAGLGAHGRVNIYGAYIPE